MKPLTNDQKDYCNKLFAERLESDREIQQILARDQYMIHLTPLSGHTSRCWTTFARSEAEAIGKCITNTHYQSQDITGIKKLN